MTRTAIIVACLLVAPAAAHPRRPHIPQNPDDDLPHMRALLAPVFAGKRDCIPSADEVAASISLDSYDGKLVACAQLPTRRGVSARFDLVSYACWNVDPSTAKLARRGDLGRGYFRCQDGSCAPGEMNRAVSYDGRTRIVMDEDKHAVTIASRSGKATRTFAMPVEIDNAMLDDDFLLLGATWLVRGNDGTYAFDDRGKRLAKLPLASQLHALDATRVLASTMLEPPTGTIYDVAKRTSRDVTLPGAFASTAVFHRGALYAMDEHRLVSLDPETFAERSRVPLKVCE